MKMEEPSAGFAHGHVPPGLHRAHLLPRWKTRAKHSKVKPACLLSSPGANPSQSVPLSQGAASHRTATGICNPKPSAGLWDLRDMIQHSQSFFETRLKTSPIHIKIVSPDLTSLSQKNPKPLSCHSTEPTLSWDWLY